MSYTPYTWQSGDTVTASRLNNIEQGVQDMNSNYTPTTWVSGDTVTAAKLNNIEQGIANGGGGSSDFSTATVTVTNNNANHFYAVCPNLFDDSIEALIDSEDLTPDFPIEAVLYNGLGRFHASIDIQVSMSGVGAVEIDGNVAYISGDCAITIS